MLAGAAPVPASSGQVVRHRLNRGGDRQLHRALPTIVLVRQVHHGPTRASTAQSIGISGSGMLEVGHAFRGLVVAAPLHLDLGRDLLDLGELVG